MPKPVPSNANPAMLRWARESAKLSKAAVARAERISEGQLEAWESGRQELSLAKLRHFAARYKRPLQVFYLPEPPSDFTVVKDFRTLPVGRSGEFSNALAIVIRRAQERQAWAAEYLEDLSHPPLEFVASVAKTADVIEVAAQLRDTLAVTIEMQSDCDGDGAFAMWRRGCEEAGMFVFQAHGIAVEEMRGFALPHKTAPVVVVNSKDAAAAKVFTLIHEVAHILRGDTVVTGSGDCDAEIGTTGHTERFCNRVAAEVLVPEKDFRLRIPADWLSRDDEVIRKASIFYGVSRAVIAYRLLDTGFADRAYITKKLPLLITKPKPKRENANIPQSVLALSRNGVAFSRLAISAFDSGAIHGGALSSLLNTSLKHLPAIESKVFPSRVQQLVGP